MYTSADTNGPIHFLNIEYFLRIIYDLLHGNISGNASANAHISFSSLIIFLTHLWFFITFLAVLLCLLGFFILSYTAVRIKQVRDAEKEKYGTINPHVAEEQVEHHRWKYISELIESGQESDWRNAIIEADIMLDDMLTRLGYQGDSIGEKLKGATKERFQTLDDAWEAHKVRNEIAHQGSTYQLTDHVAYQTIQRYRNVFEEHHEI